MCFGYAVVILVFYCLFSVYLVSIYCTFVVHLLLVHLQNLYSIYCCIDYVWISNAIFVHMCIMDLSYVSHLKCIVLCMFPSFVRVVFATNRSGMQTTPSHVTSL